MQEKKIIIIGAGIAGLSAGCYLQMNGYKTEIFEMHTQPGGLCTSWDRNGFTFDGCIHWLIGSSPNDPYYYHWNDLVDMKSIQFHDYEIFMRVEDDSENFINVYSDVDRFEEELMTKAPEDADLINQYCTSVRRFSKLNLDIQKPEELYNLFDSLGLMFKVMPVMKDFKKWGKISSKEFSEKAKNPLLKKTILHLFVPEMAALFLIFTSAWLHKRSAGYPVGGSLNFMKMIEKRYQNLGGKIHYGEKVMEILTGEVDANSNKKKDLVKGIKLENGEPHYADIVVSGADGHFTIFEMLEGRYLNDEIRGYYENMTVFPSLLQVSIGLDRSFDKEESFIVFPVDKPIYIDQSMTVNDLEIRIFNFDHTMAPKGKTVITQIFGSYEYAYWEDLKKKDRNKYKAEKKRIANEVIDHLEKRFGNIKDKVETVDVSTPATLIRYTNNWKGSFEGWVLTPDLGWKTLKKSLPGLENFYMVGQWVVPGGGLPAGLMSGRGVAQLICKRDRRKFKTVSFEKGVNGAKG